MYWVAVGRGSIPARTLPLNSRDCISVSYGGDTKSRRRSLLSGVYAKGIKISHTGGKCVSCSGLHILA